MPFYVIGVGVVIGIVLLYMLYLSNQNMNDTTNLLKDVPTININKENLEKHAEEISTYYSNTKTTNSRRQLISSLDVSYQKILETYGFIDKEVKNKNEIVPAAEWLLDNLYLIEKEYKNIKYNMPKSYYKDLPVIHKGIMKGYPRVYHIAVELVSHTDGRLEGETIKNFINAYQKNTILTSGELWALPIMLRIALVQNISKISEKIVKSQIEKQKGEVIAERIINALNEERLDEELRALSQMTLDFNHYFSERLLKVLRDNGVDDLKAYKWVDERLEKVGTDSDKIITIEHQKEANYQISMGNCVNSLRKVEALNWREYFEKLSAVESILNEDPQNIYMQMDFESRDHYRHKVEKLAKRAKLAESYVASKAIECAKNAEEIEGKEYLKHVGYYLIDDGLEKLIKKLSFKENTLNEFKNGIKKKNLGYYLGTIIICTLLVMGIFITLSVFYDSEIVWWKYLIAVIALIIPCSEIVISIFHWSITHLSEPRFIPKMEFKNGIGQENRTVIIIPTLLNSVERVHSLIDDLEVYFLANQDENLYFTLLGDFTDSTEQHNEQDKEIVKAALKYIKEINQKYCEKGKEKFFFLNRYRQYNEKEGYWLGWERKRGKIMEFNELLRGSRKTSYDVISSNTESLKRCKYVITLDADTQLPRDAAKKLIGAMTHILNRPHIDTAKKRVTRGYGLMQPRISVGTLSANKTLFSRAFSGETGIDTYTTAISDVYQDLFGEGIFTGKGIYDIDTFLYMLKDEIPENAVLSHDLLEGSYVKAGLVTDIELIDGYPAYYNSSSKRLHRWVRGDWQLLPWLTKKSPLNTLSKWKILDNLRRSLLAPSIVLLIVLSLGGILPDGGDKWFIAAFLALISPILFDVSEVVISPIKGISLSGRMKNNKMILEQVFLIFCFLPYQGYLMIDAVFRTLFRLKISKKKLLEWQTAADVERKVGRKFGDFAKGMWIGSAIAVLIFGLSLFRSVSIGLMMLPSCIIWFISPYIAYVISKECKHKYYELNENDKVMLRRLSRKTWAYFEDFTDERTNWLGPDNYQEDPDNGIAPRTSPTNMGMSLVTNAAAYDLGYIGIIETLDRLEKTIESMDKLEKYKGHYYNWYDTTTLDPLYPRFISTVDSGNLVGYFWVVAETLNDFLKSPVLSKKEASGLADTLRLGSEEIEKTTGVEKLFYNLASEIENKEMDLLTWKNSLINLKNKITDAQNIKNDDAIYWNKKLNQMIDKYLNQIDTLFPWIDLIEENTGEINEFINKISLKTPLNELGFELNSFIKFVLKSKNKNKKELVKNLEYSKEKIKLLELRIEQLISKLYDMGEETNFSALYDKDRQLFSIGYDMENDTLTNSYYDLLASESRQASFVAIAKGEIEQKHWFKLGRALSNMGTGRGLVSWSGTMFEYFMPLLIMKSYPETLMNATYKSVLEGQRKYCTKRDVPWGISESAFYNFDINRNYQYKAFGVPGIGLKRGLVNELVISPYSTIMALQKDLKGSLNNIKKLLAEGLEGRYGFFEAVDYTKERMKKGIKKQVIKCFMIHHEGMSLLALNNVLNENILQERFHNIPKVKATELLLQEKVPRRIIYDREQKFNATDTNLEKQKIIVRKYTTAETVMPETHLLSNNSYSMMISNSGSGYAKKDDTFLYRWREDVTSDCSGMFFYIKEIGNENNRKFWSAAYEPSKNEGDSYEVTFSLDKAEFERRDGDIITHTHVAVSYEDDAEVRKISITNHGNSEKVLEITSYCEATITGYDGDLVHPAFSNLFITTEYLDNPTCLLATRRPRAKGKKQPWIMQTVTVSGNTVGTVQYETARINFTGRGRSINNPQVMDNDAPLENTVGVVLDPILSLRRRIKIGPGENCVVAYTTAIGDNREQVINLARKYSDIENIERIFELAWTQSQVEMKYLGMKSSQANLYQAMASKILFLNPAFRQREEYIKNVSKNQAALWGYGISGDLPILLLLVREDKDVDLARQLLNVHEYWSLKGLKVDLVIINLQVSSYNQPLQDALLELIYSSHARDKQNKPGGVFVYTKAGIAEEDVDLLKAIARLVIDSKDGLLVSQVRNSIEPEKKEEILQSSKLEYNWSPSKLKIPELMFYNEFGGFNQKNDSYVIHLKENRNTPAPWINVVSNGDFGFHVSESGSAYTWSGNSRENKITTWSNDWISDTPSEVLYIRDEVTGDVWNITAKPIRDDGEYFIEHGFGYSLFKHEAYGIMGETNMFVPMEDDVKLYKVKLKNNSNIERRLSLTYYAQLVMGVVPQHTAQHVATYLNEEKAFIYGHNPYSMSFGKLYAYLKIAGVQEETFTGSRTEFLGRGGSVENPEALHRVKLTNTTGAGIDPCLASNGKITLAPDEEIEIVVMLGQDKDLSKIESVVEKYSSLKAVEEALNNAKEHWNKLLHQVEVKTPDKTMDLMMNGWLMYQTIVCRLWARTAFYQSGGAYGFRDQLQDVMSLSYLRPEMTRKQILYSASRQFVEGDVQHWWHPVVDSGIRTRFSDDLLWLPYVTCDYIKNTGDYSVLDEEVSYLEDDPLAEGEDERYNVARVSEQKGSIYEHCFKTLDRGLKFGVHNIPLMGSGDWNDGMSTIGNKGKGESVWVGWFLYTILTDFIELCRHKNDNERAEKYTEMREFIRENLEKNAWDGNWYRRAYFDDGTPLGSIQNEECQIDSLSQSWAVISGAGSEERVKEAMQSLEKYLIKEEKGMIYLLTPPFYKSDLEPGYIKGYVPGVRENGGQYTHAATWVILAMTRLKQCNKALKLFDMINPINHTTSYLECERFKTEPYVMTADVYGKEPHVGRGGWSWYTGTAGWMYRVGLEGILGLKLKGEKGFTVDPCVPDDWKEYEIKYSKGECKYNITVKITGTKKVMLNGEVIEDGVIPYLDKGEHEVIVNI